MKPPITALLLLTLAGCATSAALTPNPSAAQPANAPAAPAPAAPASGPGDSAAALHQALTDLAARMTAAVASASPDAYLACVSLADPRFATEQRNWAKDLTRKPPEHFQAEIGDGDPTLTPDGAAVIKLRMRWNMPGASERSIAYPARFVRGETGCLYAGESWKIVGSDRVTIFYEGDLADTAKKVAEVLPGVRAHVHQGFGLESGAVPRAE